MAITGSYSTSTGVQFNLVATYSYTQSTSANTSTVTVKLYLRHNTLYASALSGSYLSVAGNKTSYSKSISYSGSDEIDTLLATKKVTVKHSSDGKGTCAIKGAFVLNGSYSGKSIGTLTLNKTLTLKTIPRASGLSVPSSINTGSSLKLTITPSSSTFKHKVRFIIDGTTKYTSGFITADTTSYSYTIPHSWSPDKASKTMTVRLYTYDSSGTLIASTDKTTIINVPSNIVPVINSISSSLISGLDGNYVQGKSKIKLIVEAESGDGSSLTTYYYGGKNISDSNTSCSSVSATHTSSVIQSSGDLTYQVRVKDARGRYSAWKYLKIVVQPYSVPKITSIKAQRCLSDGTIDINGTYAQVTIKTSHASVNGANTANVVLCNSKDGYTTSQQVISSTSASNTYSGIYDSEFSIDALYTIKAVITDRYGATGSATVSLKAAQRSLNIAKYGNGVAIGGLSTVTDPNANGKFECNWDTEINAKLIVSGNVLTRNNFGCIEAYDVGNFAMYCQWADGNNHDILVRNSDGLTTAIGWVGNDNNETVLDIRPKRVNIRGGMYVGDGILNAFLNGSNEPVIQSTTTYNRTYDSSPNMYITSNGVLGRSSSSSERYKTEIQDVVNENLNPYNILNIPIRQYKYTKDNIPVGKEEDDVYIGIIAEEAAKAFPPSAEYNENGQIEMWNIKVLFPALLKVVQDQQKEITILKEEIQELKSSIN